MVSHVSHSVHVPPKEHICIKVEPRIVEGQSGWLGDGLTCLAFSACTTQEHSGPTKGGPRWLRTVQDG
jgi:hypothetical protein